MKKHLSLAVSVIGIGLLSFAHTISAAVKGGEGGALYVMSNKASGNSVFAYERASDGSLIFLQQIETRGLGTGVTLDPLMSQGAVALRADGKLLLVVNPASGDLTAFTVTASGLEFGSKLPSGGAFPVSVTVSGGLVYVLNQLGEPNISGFTVTDSGLLQTIPSSTRTLAGGPLRSTHSPKGAASLIRQTSRLGFTFAFILAIRASWIWRLSSPSALEQGRPEGRQRQRTEDRRSAIMKCNRTSAIDVPQAGDRGPAGDAAENRHRRHARLCANAIPGD